MKYVAMIPINFSNKELNPGDTFTLKNEDAIKGLLVEGKVRPLRDVMTEKYQGLTEWLNRHNLPGDEIKDTMPILYQNIQDTIEMLDYCFMAEDITAFQDALDKVKSLYRTKVTNVTQKRPEDDNEVTKVTNVTFFQEKQNTQTNVLDNSTEAWFGDEEIIKEPF